MTLTYEFKTELFWIVSRMNNCQYCLGHQEQKLAAAGLSEDRIAALDLEWESFTPAEQAAYAWARKLTWTPHLVSDEDIAALRKHYTDMQILEMTLSVAGNNAINRWKKAPVLPSHSTNAILRKLQSNSQSRCIAYRFVCHTDRKQVCKEAFAGRATSRRFNKHFSRGRRATYQRDTSASRGSVAGDSEAQEPIAAARAEGNGSRIQQVARRKTCSCMDATAGQFPK